MGLFVDSRELFFLQCVLLKVKKKLSLRTFFGMILISTISGKSYLVPETPMKKLKIMCYENHSVPDNSYILTQPN